MNPEILNSKVEPPRTMPKNKTKVRRTVIPKGYCKSSSPVVVRATPIKIMIITPATGVK